MKKILAMSLVFVMVFTMFLSTTVFAAQTVEINSLADFSNWQKNQQDGDIVNINVDLALVPQTSPGEPSFNSYHDFFFLIKKNNVVINGNGKTIYGNQVIPKPSPWPLQSLIVVVGDNVTINNTIVMPPLRTQKTIEVSGKNFTMKNSTISPNTVSTVKTGMTPLDIAWDESYGGSLFVSGVFCGNDMGKLTLSDCTFNGAPLSFDSIAAITTDFSNVTMNLANPYYNFPAVTNYNYQGIANPCNIVLSGCTVNYTEPTNYYGMGGSAPAALVEQRNDSSIIFDECTLKVKSPIDTELRDFTNTDLAKAVVYTDNNGATVPNPVNLGDTYIKQDGELLAIEPAVGGNTVENDLADYSLLQTAIASALAIDRTQYTTSSLAMLDATLTYATNVNNSPTAEQTTIDMTAVMLTQAVNSLQLLSGDKTLLSLSIGDNAAVINQTAKTAKITVANNTDITALTCDVLVSDGASVTVDAAPFVSGTTTLDFTGSKNFVVKAANGTTQTYVVTVTKAALSSAKKLLSLSIGDRAAVINQTAKTAKITVPYNTVVTALTCDVLVSDGASVTVDAAPFVSGTTTLDFTGSKNFVIKAEDNTTDTYTVTVTKDAAPVLSSAKKLLSLSIGDRAAVINQTAKTAKITVPYNTVVTALTCDVLVSDGATVTVDAAPFVSGTTALNFTGSKNFVVKAEDNTTDTYTVTVTKDAAPVLSSAKKLLSLSIGTNAAVISQSAKTAKITVPYGTNVNSLICDVLVSDGATVTVDAAPFVSGTTALNFTASKNFVVKAEDNTSDTYAVTVTVAAAPVLGSSKTMLALSIGDSAAVINQTAKTAKITVPYGTDVTALICDVLVSDGATVSVNAAPLVSGTTPVNFTNSVNFIIKAPDNTTETYAVTVSIAKSNENVITSFALGVENEVVTIDNTANTITVNVPAGTLLKNIVPGVVVSDGASYAPNGPQNFENPVVYTVISQSGIAKAYTIVVLPDAYGDAQLLGARIPGILTSYAIDQTAKTINITIPEGTDVKTLNILFTVSPGATVNPAAPYDLSKPVIVSVTAQNEDLTTEYTMTITIKKTTQPATILTYSAGNVKARLAVGQIKYLFATVLPKSTATAIKWVSSNPSVASVDQNGVVKALRLGVAVISAITTNGKSCTAIITVAGPLNKVSFGKKIYTVKKAKTVTLKSKMKYVSPASNLVIPGKITFVSKNKKVASVGATSGKVKGIKSGKSTVIYVKYNGKTVGKVKIKVK